MTRNMSGKKRDQPVGRSLRRSLDISTPYPGVAASLGFQLGFELVVGVAEALVVLGSYLAPQAARLTMWSAVVASASQPGH